MNIATLQVGAADALGLSAALRRPCHLGFGPLHLFLDQGVAFHR